MAARIAGITNHLRAEPIRMNEVDEQQLPSRLLTLRGWAIITTADLIQNLRLSSSIIVFDYDFLVGATDVRHTLVLS